MWRRKPVSPQPPPGDGDATLNVLARLDAAVDRLEAVYEQVSQTLRDNQFPPSDGRTG